jgi:hypothetical protein
VDPETEYWLQSTGMMVIVAVAALCTIHHLMKLAGIRMRQDLTDVEKIVQFILILMTGGLACGAGLLGAGVSLLMVLFCDNAPASACLSLAFVVLLVGGFVAALSIFAFKAMLRKDDQAIWYLRLYPILLFAFANFMLLMMPDLSLVCVGMMSMSLLAMIYALAIRKPRHPAAAARPHAVPGGTVIDQ